MQSHIISETSNYAMILCPTANDHFSQKVQSESDTIHRCSSSNLLMLLYSLIKNVVWKKKGAKQVNKNLLNKKVDVGMSACSSH